MRSSEIVRRLLMADPVSETGGDDPDPGDDIEVIDPSDPEPEPKPAEREKPKPKPKAKATVSAAELEELRRKAREFDSDAERRTQAEERKAREKEAELVKVDPVKALDSARRRHDAQIRTRDQQIADLTKKVGDLTTRLHSGVLDTGIKESIAAVARDLKLNVKDGSIPLIIKDLRDRFEVAEDEDTGGYSIAEKDTGRDVAEVMTEMFNGSYKDLFASQVETTPSGAGGGNRRPGGPTKQQPNTYASAYKKQLASRDQTGRKPSIGLIPPKAS